MTGQISTMNPDAQELLDPPFALTCRLTTARVLAIKEILIARFRREGIPMNLVRYAIATAEAQAWFSGFPHLFLPDLADEILDHLRQKRPSSHPDLAQAA